MILNPLKKKKDGVAGQTVIEEKKPEIFSARDTHASVFLVKRPWTSEKAMDLGAQNQYVFLIDQAANKNEIKKEIKRRYNVEVKAVNIVFRKGKRKVLGRTFGRTPNLKKAIVTLKKGYKIEIT